MAICSIESDFVLFASHQTHQAVFIQAFEEYFDIKDLLIAENTLKLEQIVQKTSSFIALTLITEDLTASDVKKIANIAKKNHIFAVLATDSPVKPEYLDDFYQFWPAPVRLGEIITAITTFQSQKQRLENEKLIKMGEYILDPAQRILTNKDAPPIHLTDKERDILLFLYQNKDQGPLNKEKLLGHVWQYAENVETRTLETHIYRLRQKIEKNSSCPQFLITDDTGYYLNFDQD